jgi:hypothetical protein
MVNINVVPNNSSRKVIMSTGILIRFGFEDMRGSGFSKCREIFITPSQYDIDNIIEFSIKCCKDNIIKDLPKKEQYI